MKKNYLLFSVVILLLLVSCKGKCKHKETTWVVSKDATCAQTGLQYEECVKCHEKINEQIIETKSHELEHHEALKPTCTTSGYDAYDTCKNCDYTTFKEVASIGHTYDDTILEPTCLEKGYTTHTCKTCNYTFIDNMKDSLGHLESDWIVDVKETCTNEGTKHTECTRCKLKFKEETIEKLAHEIELHERKDATCLDDGYEAYENCKNCDYTTFKKIESLGHDLVHHEKLDVTCLNNGYDAYDTCSRCDYTTFKQIQALGHSYQETIIAPTCTDKGYTKVICSRCLDITTQTYKNFVDELGHIETEWITDYDSTCTKEGLKHKNCTRCKNQIQQQTIKLKEHDLEHFEAKDATCTSNGHNKYDECKNCDYTTFEQISMLGHLYEDDIVNPTCLEQGYTKHTCSRCNDTYKDTFIEVKPHDYLNEVCSVCGMSSLENISFRLDEVTNTYTLIDIQNTTGVKHLIIPSTFNDLPVTVISDSVFEKLNELKTITIPSTITTIKSNAFVNCNALEDVYFDGTIDDWCKITFIDRRSNPLSFAQNLYVKNSDEYQLVNQLIISENLENISSNAFYGYKGLQQISYQENSKLTTINDMAFSECTNLTIVKLPQSLKTIGKYAFSKCTKLNDITLIEGLETINDFAFLECTTLENIDLVNSIKEIKESAFSKCTSLKTITLPENITYLEDKTFYGCLNLETININNSIINVGKKVFFDCEKLQYTEYENGLYLGNAENPYLVLIKTSNTSITTIKINPNIKTVANDALLECNDLTYNEYEDGLYLGNEENNYLILVKTNITNLNETSLKLHNDTKIIYNNAFSSCDNVETLSFEEGITIIPNFDFAILNSLKNLYLPKSLTKLDNVSFEKIKNGVNLYYNGTIEQWNQIEIVGQANSQEYFEHFFIKNNDAYEEYIPVVTPVEPSTPIEPTTPESSETEQNN